MFLAQIVSILTFGFLADLAKTRYKVDINLVTKIWNSIASFLPAAFFLLIGYVEHKLITLILLSGGMVLTSAYSGGYHTSIVTISPVFTSGILSDLA
jgi:uncharacterized membrane protein YjjB (DUF3815 family)